MAKRNYDNPKYTGKKNGGFFRKALQIRDDYRDKEIEELQKEIKDLRRKEYKEKSDKEKEDAFKARRNKEEWKKYLDKGRSTDVPEPYEDESEDPTVVNPTDDTIVGEYDNIPAEEDNIPEGYDDFSDEYVEDVPEDVPEIDTQIIDLPEEDENEKEIIVEHKDEEPSMQQPEEEENIDVVVPEFEDDYETSVSDEEVEDQTDYPTNEDIAEVKDTKKPAEDDKDTADEKGNQNTKENQNTKSDDSENNNSESYKRYPTALKVTEDALGEVNTIAGGVKDAAHKIGQQGTNSGSIANEVARAVPHYDYRSLFR